METTKQKTTDFGAKRKDIDSDLMYFCLPLSVCVYFLIRMNLI